MFDNYNDIMSVLDVAEALHVSKNHIYELLNAGELRGHREGRIWKVMKMSLIDYCVKKSASSNEIYSAYH